MAQAAQNANDATNIPVCIARKTYLLHVLTSVCARSLSKLPLRQQNTYLQACLLLPGRTNTDCARRRPDKVEYQLPARPTS